MRSELIIFPDRGPRVSCERVRKRSSMSDLETKDKNKDSFDSHRDQAGEKPG